MATPSIDACGRSCPEPVLMTKNALAGGAKALEVLVDNPTAVQNITRFATSRGYTVDVQQDGETYHLNLAAGK